MHFLEGGKMRISLELDICGANEVNFRNQRPRLRRNRPILVKKQVDYVDQFRNTVQNSFTFEKRYTLTLHHMLIH